MSGHGGRLRGRYAPPVPAGELTATSADGSRLYVQTHGRKGDPTVVLVHGWCCSTVFWAPVIRDLVARGHRVVAYDQRGHGRSPLPDSGLYGSSVLADDLCAVLDAALDEGERVVLGGHSMGAMTLMAAARRPQFTEHAAALMLCSTGAHRLVGQATVVPFGRPRLRTWLQRRLLNSSLPMGPVTPVSQAVLKYAIMGPDSTREQARASATVVQATDRRSRAAWGRVLNRLDLSAEVPHLTQPTRVLFGTSDKLTPQRHGAELADWLPRCEGGLQLMPGRGHMTPTEEPDTVTEALVDLARRYLSPGEADAAEATSTVEGDAA
ncbi:alpha/beta hydrolase [Streptomyces sp. NPDC005438]|uniref:alpha/beta fold hydrolase n=1 Tax=Streptomyces sp. NPDC005438 TaxID=3156880 RepID=UPI0033BCF6A2